MSSASDHAPLLAAVGSYVLTCLALRLLTGHPGLTPVDGTTVEVAWRYVLIAVVLPLGYQLCHFLATGRRDADSGLRQQWKDYRERHFSAYRVSGLLIVCLSMALLLGALWAFKRSLPDFSPLAWDSNLAALDRALHFGTHPWALLQPVLGQPAITVALDRLYYIWFLTFPIMLAWQGWSSDRRLRSQFFLTYALCWIFLGTVMAYWFSSAGPCYYGHVAGGPDPYGSLMAYLGGVDRQVSLNALAVQDYLWAGYQGKVEFVGISAMPSLHVALPVLYALVGFRRNRILGSLISLYALLVFLGSVHLGWHYAIDGYVSAIAVVAIWKLVGFYLDKEAGRSNSVSPSAAL